MHDPMTVAFEIRYPWRTRRYRNSKDKWFRNYRDSIITIWHVDPERDGSDDSCDWFGNRLTEKQYDAMYQIVRNPDDNICAYFGPGVSEDSMEFIVGCVARYAKHVLTPRKWWQHPRWHVWHWKVQCHPLQAFKRWAFSRCARCGKRFAWGATVVAGSWYGKGPRWFRGEPDVYHHDCSSHQIAVQPVEQKAM